MAVAVLLAFLFFFDSQLRTSICAVQCPDGWQPSFLDNTKCFRISSVKNNWFNAEINCRQMSTNGNSAHLVSIHSAFENGNVQADAANDPENFCDFWLGATNIQNGNFQWSDNTPFNYNNWKPGLQINNPGYNCALMNAKLSNYWTIDQCDEMKCSICEMFLSEQPPNNTTPPTSSTTTSRPMTSTTAPTSCTNIRKNFNDPLSQKMYMKPANSVRVCPVHSSPPLKHSMNSTNFATAIAYDFSSGAIILTWYSKIHTVYMLDPYYGDPNDTTLVYLSWLSKDNEWMLKDLYLKRRGFSCPVANGTFDGDTTEYFYSCAIESLPTACTNGNNQTCNKALYNNSSMCCFCVLEYESGGADGSSACAFDTEQLQSINYGPALSGQPWMPNYPYFAYVTGYNHSLFFAGLNIYKYNTPIYSAQLEFPFNYVTPYCYYGECDIMGVSSSQFVFNETLRIGLLLRLNLLNTFYFCQESFQVCNSSSLPCYGSGQKIPDWCIPILGMNTNRDHIAVTMTNNIWYIADTMVNGGNSFIIHSINEYGNITSSAPMPYLGTMADSEYSMLIGQVIRDNNLYIGLQSLGLKAKHIILKYSFDLE